MSLKTINSYFSCKPHFHPVMLLLQKDNLLGQGNQKTVYYHPDDPKLCIKFPKKGYEHALHREIKYTRRHQKKLKAISPYNGTVETSLGTGYVFELICDTPETISITLTEFMKSSYNPAKLDKKIAQLYQDLLTSGAPLTELQTCNILVRKTDPNDYDLIIIDGIGNSDFIKICDISRYFLKKKLHRKFSKCCKRAKLSTAFLT